MYTGPLQQLLAISQNERRQQPHQEGEHFCRVKDVEMANAAAGIMMMPVIDASRARASSPARPALGQRVLALWNALWGSRGLTHS